MTQLTAQELEAIRKRAEKATEGDWSYTVVGGKERTSTVASFGRGLTAIGEIKTVADAEFIAHAREDIPLLLAEIERLRDVLSHIDEISDEFYTIEVIEGVPTYVLRPELEEYRDTIQEIFVVSYEAVNEE